MIDQKKFYECLQDAGVEFVTGVPDTLLNDFCLYMASELPQDRHVIAANEGNAVALAAGYHLATGSIPLVYMQNSGIGNATNPLLSLVNQGVYAIPMVLLIGWRGAPDVKDHAQHKKQGEIMPILLQAMDIPFRIIDNDGEEAFELARWAVDSACERSGPVALLAKKGMFEKGQKDEASAVGQAFSMSREQAIHCIINSLPEDTIFVATTGRATRELYDLRRLNGMGHETDFLNVGAMGHASQIAAGIALARKDRLVVCLDADAAAIMHLGGLTTIGKLSPPNFLHVALNNGAHESVGGQESAGFVVNLTGIAENAGYRTIDTAVQTEQDLQEAVQTFMSAKGPFFVDIHIRKGIRSDLGPLKVSLSELKETFMGSIRNFL